MASLSAVASNSARACRLCLLQLVPSRFHGWLPGQQRRTDGAEAALSALSGSIRARHHVLGTRGPLPEGRTVSPKAAVSGVSAAGGMGGVGARHDGQRCTEVVVVGTLSLSRAGKQGGIYKLRGTGLFGAEQRGGKEQEAGLLQPWLFRFPIRRTMPERGPTALCEAVDLLNGNEGGGKDRLLLINSTELLRSAIAVVPLVQPRLPPNRIRCTCAKQY